MRYLLGKTACLVLSLIMTGSAFALGLGNVSGQAVFGQPLLIEIALLGSDAEIPSIECFRIGNPMAEIESAYVLRNANIQLHGERGRAKLIITTASPVRDLFIEFGVRVDCGFGLSRDYLLLTSEPSETSQPALKVKPPVSAPIEAQNLLEQTAQWSKPTLPAAPAEKFLRIENDVSLKALARQKYPLQPKAREKFIRMMAQANPQFAQEVDLIAAGTDLQIPPGLPVRRQGAYRKESKAVSTDRGAVAPQLSTSRKLAAKSAKSHQDVLVIGSAARLSATELLAEAERLTGMLMVQTSDQNKMSEKIAQLEDTLNALKKHFNGVESRINKIEVERQAEKLAAKPASLDFAELLLAVLTGGAIGGLTLHVYNRIQLRRGHGSNLSARTSTKGGGIPSAPLATSMPIKPEPEAGLPWEKHGGSTATNQTGKGTISAPLGLMTVEGEQQSQSRDIAEPAPQSPSSPQDDFDFVTKQSS